MPMTDETRLTKNKQIREAGKLTRARRSLMDCKVYHLKLQPNSTTKTKLALLFKEAKWLRNASLSAQEFSVDFLKTLTEGVPVKTPTGVELRPITLLGSQMQQATLSQLRGDLQNLAKAKKAGRKVGKLKFVREVTSINLQQLGTTYQLDFKKKRARIQNIGWVKTRGLQQLSGHAELANAKLLQKADGFYLAVTCYFPKNSKTIDFQPDTSIGLDMGVSTHLTLSDGRKLDSTVQETDRLKRLQRKLSRQVKGSKNSMKTKAKIRKEYLKMDYKKADFANKVVHDLLKYETVYLQDENLTGWKVKSASHKFGRKLQHSALGRVKAKLVDHPRTVVVGRFVPTSQYCVCGVLTKHELSERVFVCSGCGFSEDRDVHAAKNMILLGQSKIYTSGTEGSACGGSVRPEEVLLRRRLPAKQETPMALVSA